MKHGGFKVVCLVVWACMAVLSTYGDDTSIDLEAKVLETFNGDSDYVWKAEGSKFTSKIGDTSYPQITYVDAWPIAAFGNNRDGEQALKSLGIHGKFDRQEFNWIDIYPTKKDDSEGLPAEIPIPGRVRQLDMWVWGSNLHIFVEAYVRDHVGVVHTIKLGDVYYTGWKNLRAAVPTSIPQAKRKLPRRAGLSFVKFRVWTQPIERVDDFYLYFKQFKVLTDMFESYFDGDELADPEQVQKLWADANQ
jgi:hypothetical protein